MQGLTNVTMDGTNIGSERSEPLEVGRKVPRSSSVQR